ncbi:MAG: radical SAM protein [Rhodothermales bacterium]
MKCLSIHLTDLCNSECTFCVVGSPLYTTDSVRYDEVLSFLEDHQHEGYGAVNLHGGEPTIHPHFVEVLDYIRELGYSEVHLQTNGIRLARERFVKTLVERNVTKFIVSLHGDEAEYHDSQTFSPGGFAKTIEGIRNAKDHGAHVRTNTVITRQNLDRLTAISELACDLGVHHINFSNLHPVGSARFSRARIMPDLAAIRRHLYPAVDHAIACGRTVTLEGFPYCSIDGGREQLHLTNEYRHIKLLVRGQVLESYDNFMRDKMSVFGAPCSDCSVRSICGGVYPEYIDYFGWEEFSADAVPLNLVEGLVPLS